MSYFIDSNCLTENISKSYRSIDSSSNAACTRNLCNISEKSSYFPPSSFVPPPPSFAPPPPSFVPPPPSFASPPPSFAPPLPSFAPPSSPLLFSSDVCKIDKVGKEINRKGMFQYESKEFIKDRKIIDNEEVGFYKSLNGDEKFDFNEILSNNLSSSKNSNKFYINNSFSASPLSNVYTREGYMHWEETFRKGGLYDLSNGPMNRLKSTDFFFFIIFAVSFFFFIFICIDAYSKGNVSRLTRGIDFMGRVCGVDDSVKKYPFVFWPSKQPMNDTTAGYHELSKNDVLPVCTNICPAEFSYTNRPEACDEASNRLNLCTWYGLKETVNVLNRFCFFKNPNGKVNLHGIQHSWMLWMGDIIIAWPVLLICAILALVFGYLYIILVKMFSGFFIWNSLIVLEILFILFGIEQWMNYSLSSFNSYTSFSSYAWKNSFLHYNYLILFLCSSAAAILLIIVVFLFWRHICLATRILKTSSIFIDDCLAVLIFPFVSALFSLFFFAFSISAILYELSSGNVTRVVSSNSLNSYSSFDFSKNLNYSSWFPYELNAYAILKIIYLVFFSFWIQNFFSVCNQMLIAYVASAWYFSPTYADGSRCLRITKVLKQAAKTILYYHVGTAALGAAILSCIQFAKAFCRVILYLKKRNEEATSSGRWIMLNRLIDCFSSLYEIIRFISAKAYIQVALVGLNFFNSSWIAFALALRNPIKLMLVDRIGWILQLIGQILISLLCTSIAYFLVTRIPLYRDCLSSITSILLFVFIMSYFVTQLTVHTWGVVADTLLQCYIADEEMAYHEGKKSSLHAPATLREFWNYSSVLRGAALQI